MSMRKITKPDCIGCRDNFYNGNNDLGVMECWNFKDAVMVKAIDVPIDMPPPYTRLPKTVRPSCYSAKGYVRVKETTLDSRGFWRR